MLHFVEGIDEIIENVKTLEGYFLSEIKGERQFAEDLVKKERSMMVYKVNGQNHFAPIKFLGFKKNSMNAHLENEKRESRDTVPSIQLLMGKPFTHATIDKEFHAYADGFKGHTLKSKRKFWRLRDDANKYFELNKEAAVAAE